MPQVLYKEWGYWILCSGWAQIPAGLKEPRQSPNLSFSESSLLHHGLVPALDLLLPMVYRGSISRSLRTSQHVGSISHCPSGDLVHSFILSPGSSSQPTVIQESSMSPSQGRTVKFSCSLSSGQVTSYGQSWYQQKEGGPPRFLYYYYASASAGSGDLSRFSASKENNQNKWYLTIRDVQAEDEAVYYCAVWYGASSMFHSDTNL
ncbi:hypothetical protein Chor_011666 [Crotalus horridus]